MQKENAMVSMFGVAAVLACAGMTFAQGVAGGLSTTHDITANAGNGFPGWRVGNVGSPQPVQLDLGGSPWEKTLQGVGGPLVTIYEGDTFAVIEHVLPEGPNWLGWEDQILTPGWEWVMGDLIYADPSITMDDLNTPADDGLPLPGFNVLVEGASAIVGGKAEFGFDEYAPDADFGFTLVRYLRFVGTDAQNGSEEFNSGSIEIESFPTNIPAPGTLAIAGGLAALGLRRRRG